MHLDADYFDALGPNPRTVRMAAFEKGVALRTIKVDTVAGENREASFLAVNPFGTTPALRLPTGEVIADSLAICEYLEDVAPSVSLLGATAETRAITRTWLRRVECEVVVPTTLGFRALAGRAMFEPRGPVLPMDAVAATSAIAATALDAIERELCADYLAGDRFSLADIRLFVFAAFGVRHGLINLPGELQSWFERISLRPSTKA